MWHGGRAAGIPAKGFAGGPGAAEGPGAAGAGVKVSSLPGANPEPPGEVVGKVWDACAVEAAAAKLAAALVPGKRPRAGEAAARAKAYSCGESGALRPSFTELSACLSVTGRGGAAAGSMI